jgi:hypothetical protein
MRPFILIAYFCAISWRKNIGKDYAAGYNRTTQTAEAAPIIGIL